MNAEHWSDPENDVIVAVYFDMLKEELAPVHYWDIDSR